MIHDILFDALQILAGAGGAIVIAIAVAVIRDEYLRKRARSPKKVKACPNKVEPVKAQAAPEDAQHECDDAILAAIVQRVAEAREKHPVFAEGAYNALGVIEGEFNEFQTAVFHESEERQQDEALDVMATCYRFLKGEHKGREA